MHPDIYNAVYRMKPGEQINYIQAWHSKYPGREDIFDEAIDRYLDPPHMLFSAPVTNPLLAFMQIIARANKLTVDLKSVAAKPVVNCTTCSLPVTMTIDKTCLACREKSVQVLLTE